MTVDLDDIIDGIPVRRLLEAHLVGHAPSPELRELLRRADVREVLAQLAQQRLTDHPEPML